MKKLFLCIPAALTLASCNQNTSKKADANDPDYLAAYHITMEKPAGWQKKDTVEAGRKMVFFVAPANGSGYNTNINLLKDPMNGMSFDDYMKRSMTKLASLQVKVSGSGDMEVDGVKIKTINMSAMMAGKDVSVKSYIIPIKDSALIVTSSTTNDQKSTFEPIFDKSVKSIHLGL